MAEQDGARATTKKVRGWLEGAQKRKEALLVAGAGAVIGLALLKRKKGAQQGTTPGTSTSTTPTPVPTADTTANDIYNSLFDNLLAQLRSQSAGSGSPSGSIGGSSTGGSGGAGGGPGPVPNSVPPSSAMPSGSNPFTPTPGAGPVAAPQGNTVLGPGVLGSFASTPGIPVVSWQGPLTATSPNGTPAPAVGTYSWVSPGGPGQDPAGTVEFTGYPPPAAKK